MSLSSFFDPSSIVIVSTSFEEGSNVYTIKERLKKEFKGKLFIVSPKNEKYKSVRQLKSPVDLAIISASGKSLMKFLTDCHKKGIKNIVLLKEPKVNRKKFERFIERKKFNILYGELYIPRKINLVDDIKAKSGNVAIISNDQVISRVILNSLADVGVFSYVRFSDIGLGMKEILTYLSRKPEVKVTVVYLDRIKDVNTLKTAKKIIFLANKYTKDILTNRRLFWVDDIEELVDYSKVLSMLPKSKIEDLLLITDGYQDMIDVDLKQPSSLLSKKLKKILRNKRIENPLVVKNATPDMYKSIINAAEKEYGGILIVPVRKVDENLIYALAVLRKLGKTIFVTLFEGGEIRERFESFSIPVFTSLKKALKAYSILLKYGE